MKKIELFANYGVLAHEKQPCFTYGVEHNFADYSEKITVEIPEDFEILETQTGLSVKVPEMNFTYDINEILGNIKNEPCFTWYDGNVTRRKKLKVLE